MSSDISWTYPHMYSYYSKQDMIKIEDGNIIAIVYESQKVKKPKKGEAILEPFIKRNIKYVGLSPVQDKSLFPNGVFLAYDHNLKNDRWLYFVFPTMITCGEKSFLAANHFSFVHDHDHTNKECHFHRTDYNCVYDNIAKNVRYSVQHMDDYFPDKLQLNMRTATNDEMKILNRTYTPKQFVLKLIKHPWLYNTSGGTKKRNPLTQTARQITNMRFCELWDRIKFRSMTAFGIKHQNEYHWSIHFKDRRRWGSDQLYAAFYMTTKVNDDHEEKLQELLADEITAEYSHKL